MSEDPNTESRPIPPDDPRRNLTHARPDEDRNLPHVGLVGDTYTTSLRAKTPPVATP